MYHAKRGAERMGVCRRAGAAILLSGLSRMFLVSNLDYWRFNHFYLPPLSIQMPFHIRKLESALLMQDLLALLSSHTEE